MKDHAKVQPGLDFMYEYVSKKGFKLAMSSKLELTSSPSIFIAKERNLYLSKKIRNVQPIKTLFRKAYIHNKGVKSYKKNFPCIFNKRSRIKNDDR